jgi:hypothetical protein
VILSSIKNKIYLALLFCVFLSILFIGFLVKENNSVDSEVKSYLSSSCSKVNCLQRLDVHVSMRGYIDLLAKRNEALDNRGILISSKKDFVKARVGYDGQWHSSKIRLKGDLKDHFEGADKWSLRIKLKKAYMYGMKEFSIQDPKVRGGISELYYVAMARMFGILAPRYKLVDVYFNNQHWGLMEIEEHVTETFLELAQVKSSPIFVIDDSDFWLHFWVNGGPGNHDSIYTAPLKFYKGKDYSPLLENYVRSIFHGWQEGRLPASDVFNLEQMAILAAINDGWGHDHGLIWNNVKFYLNPFTLKIEPIAFDNGYEMTRIQPKKRLSIRPLLFSELYKDKGYRLALIEQSQKILERIDQIDVEMNNVYLNDGAALNDITFDSSLFAKNIMAANKLYKDIQQLPYRIKYSSSFKAHRYANLVGIRRYDDQFRVHNNTLQPVLISYVELGEMKTYELAASLYHERPAKKYIKNAFLISSITVSQNDVINEYTRDDLAEIPGLDLGVQYPKHDVIPNFVKYDSVQNSYLISSGEWDVVEPIIIRSGAGLEIQSGAVLSFEESAYLHTNGQIDILGEPDKEVVLTSTGASWRGVYVEAAEGLSKIQHARFDNGTNFKASEFLELTGFVNFYQSDVMISNSQFQHIFCEDGLNITGSKVEVFSVVFADVFSDAFDCDFCELEIGSSRFSRVGGDALDVSGSDVKASKLEFYSVNDKAVSVGEASSASVIDTRFVDVGAGVVSKDGSTVMVSNLLFEGEVKSPLMSYIKKPFYGPSSLAAFTIKGVSGPFKVDERSSLSIDGEEVVGGNLNVDTLYKYGWMKK